MRYFLVLSVSSSILFACAANNQPAGSTQFQPSTSVPAASTRNTNNEMLGLPPLPVPADNPQTAKKIALGKRLFEDRRFSADGTINCATCHAPEKAFTDQRPLAEGIQKQIGTRNSPTVINAAYYTSQFWDGRRTSLEEQSKDPFTNPIEHGLKDHGKIVGIVRSEDDYRRQFSNVFQINPDNATIDHVVKAIASFERTIVAGDSPFDRHQYGGDKTALSDSAIRGLALYRGKARCVSCHTIEETSATFTNNDFHNLGVGFFNIEDNDGEGGDSLIGVIRRVTLAKKAGEPLDETVLTDRQASELGRFAVTLETSDIGRFKTPTLRNIALTAPYMHDGSLATLEDVIELYNRGGDSNPALDSGIRPLKLTPAEKTDLVAFLKALTSNRFAELAVPTGEKQNEH